MSLSRQWWIDQLLILLLHISYIPGVCFVLKLICMLGKSKGLHLNRATMTSTVTKYFHIKKVLWWSSTYVIKIFVASKTKRGERHFHLININFLYGYINCIKQVGSLNKDLQYKFDQNQFTSFWVMWDTSWKCICLNVFETLILKQKVYLT